MRSGTVVRGPFKKNYRAIEQVFQSDIRRVNADTVKVLFIFRLHRTYLVNQLLDLASSSPIDRAKVRNTFVDNLLPAGHMRVGAIL